MSVTIDQGSLIYIGIVLYLLIGYIISIFVYRGQVLKGSDNATETAINTIVFWLPIIIFTAIWETIAFICVNIFRIVSWPHRYVAKETGQNIQTNVSGAFLKRSDIPVALPFWWCTGPKNTHKWENGKCLYCRMKVEQK